jgi:sulfate transport system substrate-binding protein
VGLHPIVAEYPNRTTVFSVLPGSGRQAAAGLALAGLAAAPVALFSVSAPFASPAQAQQAKGKQEILLVSYAVTKAAYDRIIPLFEADWKKKTGQTVDVKTSFGGSGSQTRAVIDGLQADVVGLALEADVLKLQEAGLIKPGWKSENPNSSIITNSVVAFFVRPGNPKKISGWKDLDNKNVDVVTANPKTSGGARWNFLGLWGAITRTGGTEAQARSFLTTVYRNVDVLPKDAREATDTFVKRRKGDVLLNYENEAILARRNKEWTVPYKLPSPNILIEGPIAVVDKTVDKRGTRQVAQAFTRFLYTPAAQKVFVEEGFRPVTAEGKAFARGKFQEVETFTARDFGGWASINKKFFGPKGLWDQIFAKSR